MKQAWLVLLSVLVALLATPRVASAAVHRFAVLIGNNEGAASEPTLRFADSDAAKMGDVLRDLGDFPTSHVIVLKGESADDVRKAIVDTNDRIRLALQTPDDQATLVVYYSGHADANALHLGKSSFELRELEQLVRGSSANYRLLIVDACRSGALTRVKGGDKAPPIAIRADLSLASQGAVFLTSSAAGEDAQESDTLKGSFFTHYFVSGLRGAADADADGKITIDEAYEHAYDATIRATSTSAVGVQHPTFRYEIRGRSPLVLTAPGLSPKLGAKLSFPKGRAYLVFAGSDRGAVVGEVIEQASSRTIAVRAGKYFVRGRSSDYILEGTLEVAAGSTLDVADAMLTKAAYARLVRKGSGPVSFSHGPRAAYSMRTGIVDGSSLCHGATLGWAFAQEYVEIVPSVSYCRATFENDVLNATQHDVMAAVAFAYVFDLPVVSFGLGLSAGGGVLHQTFQTAGLAPPRNTAVGRFSALGRMEVDVAEGFYFDVQAEAQTSLFAREVEGDSSVGAALAFRPSVGLGKWF